MKPVPRRPAIPSAAPRGRQRGWIGLIVLLLALLIVALLGKTVLQTMLGGATPPVGKAGERTAIVPTDVAPATEATPTAQSPIERARGVDAFVQQQTEAQKRDVDAATR